MKHGGKQSHLLQGGGHVGLLDEHEDRHEVLLHHLDLPLTPPQVTVSDSQHRQGWGALVSELQPQLGWLVRRVGLPVVYWRLEGLRAQGPLQGLGETTWGGITTLHYRISTVSTATAKLERVSNEMCSFQTSPCPV